MSERSTAKTNAGKTKIIFSTLNSHSVNCFASAMLLHHSFCSFVVFTEFVGAMLSLNGCYICFFGLPSVNVHGSTVSSPTANTVNGPHGALAVSLAQVEEHPVPGLTLAMATLTGKSPFADKTQDTALGAHGLSVPPVAEVDFRPGVGCTSVERKNLNKKHSKCEDVHDNKVNFR